MSFLKQDEFMILMNPNRYVVDNWGSPTPIYVPSVSDRIHYYDAGIRTSIEFPQWFMIEPAKGYYAFHHIGEMIQLNRDAGLKTIISFPGAILPDWMPNEWMIMNKEGVPHRRVFSLWNEEAQTYLRNFCASVIHELDAEDVLFIFAFCETGEAILPTEPHFYDPYALAEYCSLYGTSAIPEMSNPETREWLKVSAIKYMMDVSEVFYPHKKEIWNMQQWLFNEWSNATLNYMQPELMKLYRDRWNDLQLTLLQYTYFDDSHPKANEDYVDMLRDTTNCDVIVEAMFCKGLPTTTPKAIAKGFRGQIVSPTHPMSGHNSIQPWMLDEIKKSINLWRKSYENSGSD